jgi:hypothetical protein
MQKIMAVYSSDAIYATRFMEFLKKRKEPGFEIAVFTSIKSLVDYSLINEIEILLLGETISEIEDIKHNSKYIYQLFEHPDDCIVKNIPGVFKYQSAKKIIAEIILDYDRKTITGSDYESRNNIDIISVIPVNGNLNKVSFAWSLAFLLSERKNVLFIVMDLIPVSLLGQADETNHSLSEFIYYLKENNPGVTMKIKQLIESNGGLSYLTGLTHGWDLLSLTKEDMKNCIEEIRLHTDFNTVIFYLGYYADSMMEVINQSDIVFISILDNSYEREAALEWERQMKLAGLPVEQKKFTRVFMEDKFCVDVKTFSKQELKKSAVWLCAKEYAERM